MSEAKIVRAGPDDAGELLTLQYAAFLSEARVYERLDLPPLKQTFDELRSELGDHPTWKAVVGTRIVGSIRVHREEDVLHVGRIMVAPDQQGRGIGSRLLAAVEDDVPAGVERLSLFTGFLSTGNLRLYERVGYREVGRRPGPTGVMLVYLEKTLATPG
ncbi:GNAT family N-acetyltransferase [Phytomonospora endophytica]|uniref:Ribosomal protein S18 acetylase RimI-like enzyme n=1 Tax=Phytomonospora endophytica TaxID=714109 RepID=A0A841G387_9ACTN|nr:GNAT family N-acetyltransferase [Phytomonospora endophytica]MBB6039179.1 ribosomal protein S18 acetylase RimI-like enzyme [Phytomonospora endophytica]GIG67584.1 GCN5 family acetyltransferase [Phytomonospora endophytica]